MTDEDKLRLEAVRRRLRGDKVHATPPPMIGGYADEWRNSLERALRAKTIDGKPDHR